MTKAKCKNCGAVYIGQSFPSVLICVCKCNEFKIEQSNKQDK